MSYCWWVIYYEDERTDRNLIVDDFGDIWELWVE